MRGGDLEFPSERASGAFFFLAEVKPAILHGSASTSFDLVIWFRSCFPEPEWQACQAGASRGHDKIIERRKVEEPSCDGTRNGLNLFDMGIMLAATLRCRVTRWLINMSRDYLHIWDSYSWWNCVPRKREPKADISTRFAASFCRLLVIQYRR